MMKNLKLLIASIFIISGGVFTSAQEKTCESLFYGYYDKFKRDNLEGSYPEWKQAFDKGCEGYKYYENILTDGEGILDFMLINAANKADTLKFATDLKKIKEKRIVFDPELALYWESAVVATEDTYGMISKEEAFKKYQDIFERAKIKDSELTSEAVLGYFNAALDLYGAQKIGAKELMNAYSDDIKVIKRNAEIRTLKATDLQQKKDSLGSLTKDEEYDLEELNTFAEYFLSIEQTVAGTMAGSLNCTFLNDFYKADYEANKDSLKWLNGAVYGLNNLIEGGCEDTDSTFYAKLNTQFIDVYCKENPEACKQQSEPTTSTATVASNADPDEKNAINNYTAKRYRAAIPYLNKVVNKKSGSAKGTYAYYLADSYMKTGNRTNAAVWFRKAAQYKPGWAAPYSQLARIFGDKARINSCGKDKVQKLAGYLVAADYMKKAARYNGSLRKYVSQYEAVGPSSQDIFQGGYKKGQKIRVTCNGGATTTLR